MTNYAQILVAKAQTHDVSCMSLGPWLSPCLYSGMPAEGADPNCNMPFLRQRESNSEKNHAMDLDMIFPYFCSYFIVQASHTANPDISRYRGIPPTERTLKEGCCRERQLVFKENITTVSKVSQAERGKAGIWILFESCNGTSIFLFPLLISSI